MIVVTSGKPYIDIDALACIVGYAELLKLRGNDAQGVSTSSLNESITASLKADASTLATAYQPAANDTFVIVDLSVPEQFDPIVDPERVVELFDHHPGQEAYWAGRLGAKSHLEFIGATATLIFEAWQRENRFNEMSMTSARLLAAAILDNTLNFGAGVTSSRDRAAFRALAAYTDLDEAWAARYFSEVQQSTLADLAAALRNDTKYFRWDGLAIELTMGQVVVWDARSLIARQLDVLPAALDSPDLGKGWLVNIVSISEGRSYFVSNSPKVQQWLHELIGVTFDGSVARAGRLWLRKEILKAAQKSVR